MRDEALDVQLDEMRVAAGLAAVERAGAEAGEAVTKAVTAICSYRCRSLAEVRRWGAVLAEVITVDEGSHEVVLSGADWANITAALSGAGANLVDA